MQAEIKKNWKKLKQTPRLARLIDKKSMGTNEFTTKILPLKNNLFRVVFRITGDVEQSEQIVQEALLKVWEDRDSWIVIENLPSYCMMVARNLALRETYSGNKERMDRYAVR